MQNGQTFKVNSKAIKIIGWANIIFFLFCAGGSYLSGQGHISPLFLLFVALGVYLVLAAGEIQMSGEKIAYSTPLATYQIRWDEVTKIEIDHQGGGLVFFAADRNKRLAVPGPMYWSGPDKENMGQLLFAMREERQIAWEQTPRAAYTFSKNTKVGKTQ